MWEFLCKLWIEPLSMDPDSSLFSWVYLYVLTVRWECIRVLTIFNVEDLKSHSSAKSPLLWYFIVSPSTFEKVLDNLNDAKTIFFIHNSLDFRLQKHWKSISSLCHELRHGHSVVLAEFEVTSGKSDDFILIDAWTKFVPRVEEELQSGYLRKTGFFCRVWTYSVLKSIFNCLTIHS